MYVLRKKHQEFYYRFFFSLFSLRYIFCPFILSIDYSRQIRKNIPK